MHSIQHHKSIFISDIHLGSQDCKADFLLSFLNANSCDTLFLIGDIVDMWAMSKTFRWPPSHNAVLHKIIEISHTNTRVVYLPGNHDEPLQKYSGLNFGDIEIYREYIHSTADDRRYLIMHGDQCDEEVALGKFHAWVGDKGYDLLLWLNRFYNRVLSKNKGNYWSLAGYIKSHIKGAHRAIARYKHAVTSRAVQAQVDGVICGHIHHPEKDVVNGVEYHNDGDWVENCSALTEDINGKLSLVHWVNQKEKRSHFRFVEQNNRAA